MMKSAAAGGRLVAFRFILCLIIITLCAATAGGEGGQPPRCDDGELMARQEEEIRRAKDLLIHDYKSMLQAQGELIAVQVEFRAMQEEMGAVQAEFRAMQEEMGAMLDNTTAALEKMLHDALVLESDSRIVRAFFFYSVVAFFFFYVRTCAQETFRVRGHLFLGLCATMMLEAGLVKLKLGGRRIDDDDYITQLFWVLSKVSLLRTVSVAAAAVHVLHSIVTHRRRGYSQHV